MRGSIQAVMAGALLAAIAAAPLPTKADVTVTFNPGGVAYGYQDGYWDRGHHWRHWPNEAAARDWREHNASHFYNYRHDRGRHAGWRGDNWWQHR